MHIRGGKLKNVLLRADCTYSRMLSKCINEIFPDEDEQSLTFILLTVEEQRSGMEIKLNWMLVKQLKNVSGHYKNISN